MFLQTNTAIAIGKNNRDIEEYGTPSFPAAVFEVCLRKTPLGFYNPHWHNRLHVMYPVSGSSIQVTTETKQYVLSDLDAIFLNNGVLHSVSPIRGRESTFMALLFDRKLIAGFSGSILERDMVLPMSSFGEIILCANNVAHAKVLEHIQVGVSSFFSQSVTHEMAFCIEMMSMWKLLIEGCLFQQVQRSTTGSDLAKSMIGFISENYSRDITLNEITSAANISRSQGSKIFKSYVGQTIFEYLLRYRIEQSIELLVNTDYTISYIAQDSGFCSASHFIQRFKQIIGRPPGDYRRHA